MLPTLIARDGDEFARKYIGSGYKQNHYDEKPKAACNSFK